ncbi:MAG: prephenate dehydratase domain-containing protein, partial [Actinomycetota bacterium]
MSKGSIAYQGEMGAYSEEAVMKLFPDHHHRPLASIRKVFESVEVGRTDLGLVP